MKILLLLLLSTLFLPVTTSAQVGYSEVYTQYIYEINDTSSTHSFNKVDIDLETRHDTKFAMYQPNTDKELISEQRDGYIAADLCLDGECPTTDGEDIFGVDDEPTSNTSQLIAFLLFAFGGFGTLLVTVGSVIAVILAFTTKIKKWKLALIPGVGLAIVLLCVVGFTLFSLTTNLSRGL